MIKTILFATDFTSITARAEAYALSIAKAMGASVTLIHAIEPVDGATDEIQGFLESRRKSAENKIEEIAARFRAEDVECHTRVEIGKRWKAVADAGSGGPFDMVVLGSHKIRDGDKVYLGTTTHKVFFATDVPLMVVPPN